MRGNELWEIKKSKDHHTCENPIINGDHTAIGYCLHINYDQAIGEDQSIDLSDCFAGYSCTSHGSVLVYIA